MKCLLISENAVQVSGFRKMEIESILSTSDEMSVSEVLKALSCRNVGTLVLSKHVGEICKSVLDSHRKSARLPYVMTLRS